MIKANELRIGNYVNHEKTGIIQVNGALIYDQAWHDRDPEEQPFSVPIHPILLTPEWLERCGFLQMEFTYADGSTTEAFVYKGRRYIIRRIELKEVEPYYAVEYFPYPQSHNCIPSELRYLHYLQNLYFALTGEELQIKMP